MCYKVLHIKLWIFILILQDVFLQSNARKIRGFLTETDTQTEKIIRDSVEKDLKNLKGNHESASKDNFGKLNASNPKMKSENDQYDYYDYYKESTPDPGVGYDYVDYQGDQIKTLGEAYEQLENGDEEKETNNKDPEENEVSKDAQDEYLEKVSDGVCSYYCKGWPYNNCKTKYEYRQGNKMGSMSASCGHPYSLKDGRKILRDLDTSCGDEIPKCKRCDDFCSVKDGMADKKEYHKKGNHNEGKEDNSNESEDDGQNDTKVVKEKMENENKEEEDSKKSVLKKLNEYEDESYNEKYEESEINQDIRKESKSREEKDVYDDKEEEDDDNDDVQNRGNIIPLKKEAIKEVNASANNANNVEQIVEHDNKMKKDTAKVNKVNNDDDDDNSEKEDEENKSVGEDDIENDAEESMHSEKENSNYKSREEVEESESLENDDDGEKEKSNGCSYSCDSWPFKNCNMTKDGRWAMCSNPYTSEEKETIYTNYPMCSDHLPEGCDRCDDVCAKKDGRKGKDDYKIKVPGDSSSITHEEVSDGYCTYNCTDWPFAQCKMKHTENKGKSMSATCGNPYTDKTKQKIYKTYPNCGGDIPKCKRCDDYCSKKDGKSSKETYKEERKEIPKDAEVEFHEEASDGFCSYNCKGWPFSHCKTKYTSSNGYRQTTCGHPYTSKDRKKLFSNYPECGEDIPLCKRCDDFCSIKDGKADKTEYREERDQPKDDHSSEDIDNDSNSDSEEDKKSAGESEETNEIEKDDSSSNQIDETNEEGSKEKEDYAGESAENRWRRIRF